LNGHFLADAIARWSRPARPVRVDLSRPIVVRRTAGILVTTIALALSMSADAFAAALGKGAALDNPRLSEALRLAKARPELCTDVPGFDRRAFHQQFDAEVLAFFRAQLGD
jgi:hypothetical protein